MKKISLIIFLVLIITFLLFEIYWLAFSFLIALGIHLLFVFNIPFLEIIWNQKWVKALLAILAILLIASFLRLFIFELFEIPSDSMKDTLIPGDKIMVNKLCYGPNMPASPLDIPWVNLIFMMNRKVRTNPDSIWWNTIRLSGFGTLQRGDVLVFESPNKNELYLIKRCVAIPGDTLSIQNDQLVINNQKQLAYSDLIRNRYAVWFKDVDLFNQVLNEMKIYPSQLMKEGDGIYTMEFNQKELNDMIVKSALDSFSLDALPVSAEPYCFPKNPDFKWNIDQFGPVWIPQKGAAIKMNFHNYNLYRKVLNHYEGRKIHPRGAFFYDHDSLITSYTFKNDYFFVLGDNRQNSRDSRYLGFIPEKKIIGKATRILFSNTDGKIKWKRTLKKIN